MNQPPREPVVFRQLAIPVSTFDRIKDYQRQCEASTGLRLTITQTISAIVREQQATEEREAQHARTNKQPAILRKH
jgi:hypothetical protein